MSTDMLWRVLQRFDVYAGTPNTRVSAVMAFNSLVAGSILLKWGELVGQFNGLPRFFPIAAGTLFAAIACGALVSLVFVLLIVLPHRQSQTEIERADNDARSLFFFDDVTALSSPAKWRERADGYDDARLRIDLAAQVHEVARSAREKYRLLRRAVSVVLWVQIPAVALVLLLLLTNSIIRVRRKAKVGPPPPVAASLDSVGTRPRPAPVVGPTRP